MEKQTPKMSAKPPRARTPEAFIEAAGRPEEYLAEDNLVAPVPEAPAEKKIASWEAPGVREDVLKIFNLRLPEPYMLKLDYLAACTNKSRQAILKEAIFPFIDAEIEKMNGGL